MFGYNTKFSGLANKELEMYCHQLGELAFKFLGVKGLKDVLGRKVILVVYTTILFVLLLALQQRQGKRGILAWQRNGNGGTLMKLSTK